MAKRKKENNIKAFDIVLTNDKNFNNEGYTKGIKRQVVVISKNQKKNKIAIVKTHSMGDDEETRAKREVKEKKGQLMKINNGIKDIYVENIVITEFANKEPIPDKYNHKYEMYSVNKNFPKREREKLYNHITKNKKQKNVSSDNKDKLKKFKSNKKKKGSK